MHCFCHRAGPLSEAAGDEQAHLRPDTEQKGQAGLQGEEDEGDNRSFYISDSQVGLHVCDGVLVGRLSAAGRALTGAGRASAAV